MRLIPMATGLLIADTAERAATGHRVSQRVTGENQFRAGPALHLVVLHRVIVIGVCVR